MQECYMAFRVRERHMMFCASATLHAAPGPFPPPANQRPHYMLTALHILFAGEARRRWLQIRPVALFILPLRLDQTCPTYEYADIYQMRWSSPNNLTPSSSTLHLISSVCPS